LFSSSSCGVCSSNLPRYCRIPKMTKLALVTAESNRLGSSAGLSVFIYSRGFYSSLCSRWEPRWTTSFCCPSLRPCFHQQQTLSGGHLINHSYKLTTTSTTSCISLVIPLLLAMFDGLVGRWCRGHRGASANGRHFNSCICCATK